MSEMLTYGMPWFMLSAKGQEQAAKEFLNELDFVSKLDFLIRLAEYKVGPLSDVSGDVLGPAWDAARAIYGSLVTAPLDEHPRILCAYYDTPILWDPDRGFLMTCNTSVQRADQYKQGDGSPLWHCPEDWPAERHIKQQEELRRQRRLEESR